MRADSSQPYYAPSSVGGLMDPDFLRSARRDADGGSPVFLPAPPALWQRVQAAAQTVFAVLRHP